MSFSMVIGSLAKWIYLIFSKPDSLFTFASSSILLRTAFFNSLLLRKFLTSSSSFIILLSKANFLSYDNSGTTIATNQL